MSSDHTATTMPCNFCSCCAAHSITLTNLTSISDIPDNTIAAIMKAVHFNSGPYSDAIDRVRNTAALWPYNNPRQAEDKEQRRAEWEEMLTDHATNLRTSKWVIRSTVPPGWTLARNGMVWELGAETETGEHEGEGENEQGLGQEGEGEDQGGGEEEEGAVAQRQPTWAEVQRREKDEEDRRVQEAEEQQQREAEREAESRRTKVDVFEGAEPARGW